MQVMGYVLVAAGVVILLLVLVRAILRGMRGAAGIADVTIEDGKLVVRPRGFWKLWAFCPRMVIPLAQVEGCRADADPRSSHQVTLRIGGTSMPGTVRAGYMIGEDGRSWWLCRRGDNAVVIDLDGDGLAYLVVEVDDPSTTVQLIRGAL